MFPWPLCRLPSRTLAMKIRETTGRVDISSVKSSNLAISSPTSLFLETSNQLDGVHFEASVLFGRLVVVNFCGRGNSREQKELVFLYS